MDILPGQSLEPRTQQGAQWVAGASTGPPSAASQDPSAAMLDQKPAAVQNGMGAPQHLTFVFSANFVARKAYSVLKL